MHQGLRLLPKELAHFGIAVAKSVHGYTSCKVKVPPILDVPEVAAFTLGHDGWRPYVGGYNERGMAAS